MVWSFGMKIRVWFSVRMKSVIWLIGKCGLDVENECSG